MPPHSGHLQPLFARPPAQVSPPLDGRCGVVNATLTAPFFFRCVPSTLKAAAGEITASVAAAEKTGAAADKKEAIKGDKKGAADKAGKASQSEFASKPPQSASGTAEN